MKRVHVVVVSALVVLSVAIGAGQTPSGADRLNADVFASLQVRSIGPALVTGRVVDIEIDPKNANVWYVASAFGGLWKTTNRGVTFTQIFPVTGSGAVDAFSLCCVSSIRQFDQRRDGNKETEDHCYDKRGFH